MEEPSGFVREPWRSDVRLEDGIARAEQSAIVVAQQTAELYAALDDTLREAAEHPELYVPRREHVVPTDEAEFAVRSAVLDLATRIGCSEATVRDHALTAATLRAGVPAVWAEFWNGRIGVANARAVADMVLSLPREADFAPYEAVLVDAAMRFAPARFRARLRVLRERIHPRTLEERHRDASVDRRVVFEAADDGMAWLHLYLPAATARRAAAHVRAAAATVSAAPDETRTADQVRADVAGDLLTGGPSGVPTGRVGVTVAVTVPVLTLLGRDDEPAQLDGYGPIDAQTARELCAQAPSFFRLLTHPVTGTVIEVDRATYRPPADLQRLVRLRYPRCTAPGCGRAASECDLDHIVARVDGGATAPRNLAPLCRGHHRVKHVGGWFVERLADHGLRWTSPTGHVTDSDPPPF